MEGRSIRLRHQVLELHFPPRQEAPGALEQGRRGFLHVLGIVYQLLPTGRHLQDRGQGQLLLRRDNLQSHPGLHHPHQQGRGGHCCPDTIEYQGHRGTLAPLCLHHHHRCQESRAEGRLSLHRQFVSAKSLRCKLRGLPGGRGVRDMLDADRAASEVGRDPELLL